jgi:hypothetical protein
MREEVEMVRSFRKLEGEEFLKVKKELLVANNKKMMEKMLKSWEK